MARPELPPGPQRELRDAIYTLYEEADRPRLADLASMIADDDRLDGAPGKDVIGRIISTGGPARREDTIAVAITLAGVGGQEVHGVAAAVGGLWMAAQPSSSVNAAERLRSGIALGDYRYHVAGLTADMLEGRDAELAVMADFCSGQGRALFWQAPPKGGKTALLAQFVLEPPEGVLVAAFFVDRRLALHSDSNGFLDQMVPQLERVAGLTTADPRKAGYFQRILDEVGKLARQHGRRLVLVIDALDEDAGLGAGTGLLSIAAMLNKVPGEVKVISASREHPALPSDLSADNPLRTATVCMLSPSPVAAMTVQQAAAELDDALAPPEHHLRRRIAGLVLASGGGLTLTNLRELTGDPAVGGVMRSSFGRTFRLMPAGTGRTGADLAAYAFSHDTLREQAAQQLAHDLPLRLNDIRAWADAYRQRGWPEETPRYALEAYGHVLASSGLGSLMLANAVDPDRHDRMLAVTGNNNAGLREVEAALALMHAQSACPDLAMLCRLGIEYERVTERATVVPTRLPAVWAQLGDVDRARQAVDAIIEHRKIHRDAAAALDQALQGHRYLGRKWLYVFRSEYGERVWDLADAAVALAAMGDLPSARRLASRIGRVGWHSAGILANHALALAAAAQADQSVRAIRAAQRRLTAEHNPPYARLAEAAVLAGLPEVADECAEAALAASPTVILEDGTARFKNGLGEKEAGEAVWACAAADRVEQAVDLALAFKSTYIPSLDEPLVRAAEALARGGHLNAALRVADLDDQERYARAATAEVLALSGRYADAERVIDGMPDGRVKAEGMAGIAWVAAVAGSPQARHLAGQALVIAHKPVNTARAVEVATGIASAAGRCGPALQCPAQALARSAEQVAQRMTPTEPRARSLALAALCLAACGQAQDADRLARQAADEAYQTHADVDKFAEVARALAATGHAKAARDAASKAMYLSLRWQNRYYLWWTRTLVTVLCALGGHGHRALAERIAGSITNRKWRNWTLHSIACGRDEWSGHDWTCGSAVWATGQAPARYSNIDAVDPCGQEESLRQIAEGLSTALATSEAAGAIAAALTGIARIPAAWIDLLPVAATTEPERLPEIAAHAAKAWPLLHHTDPFSRPVPYTR